MYMGNSKKLIKTIECVYRKAPCFDHIFPMIKNIIEYENKNLARFIGNSIIQIAGYLNLKTKFIYSSEIEKNSSLRAQEKIIHICEILGAKYYYNAIGGMELYNTMDFEKKGIELKFLKTNLVEYKQFNNEFIPYLSILDVIMFNSPTEINKMLDNYELI